MKLTRLLVLLLLIFVAGRLHAQAVNVVLLDDVGLADFDEVANGPYAPNLAKIARDGFQFRNAHSMSICQPTRRSIDFGNFNPNWVGQICRTGDPFVSLSEVSLPEQLPFVSTMFFGKWHEGTNPTGARWELSPQAHGWGGWRGGVGGGVSACGGVDYFNWMDVEDGTSHLVIGTFQPAVQYARWQQWWVGPRGPKLSMYSIPLAHAPYQRPPNGWLFPGYPATPGDRSKYKAMIDACDVTIGKMLANMGPDDVLIVLGDNGTPGSIAPEPGRAKGTTFARGIDIPFIVYGHGFKGTSNALVHVTDVYATVAELFGIETPKTFDSRSLVPLMLGQTQAVHEYLVCGTLGHDEVQDDVCALSLRYKFRIPPSGAEEFYDLEKDPAERTNFIADPTYMKPIALHRAWLYQELGL